MTIAKAIRDRLHGEATVNSLVGTFADRPAVFEKDATPVGYDVENNGACVVIGGAVGSQNQDTTDAYRSTETYRIRCYAPEGRENAQKLAEAVKLALHDKPLSVDGFEISGMTATRPTGAPTSSPSVEGRLVNLTIHLKEL